MRRIVVVEHLSLDGVMQAPAAPDEDTRGGFEHGGWASADEDEVMGREMGGGLGSGPAAMLFGRQTYEHMYSYWPTAPQPNPFTHFLNRAQKYVASTTLAEPLPWENSTLLSGDVPAALGDLKAEPGPDLVVLGSGVLVQSLLPHGLIDELKLLIHPVLLGSGLRLFPDDSTRVPLHLAASVVTTTGVVIATYRAA
jgi:dihydrofolate reductase